jgi:hypothetical protein
MRIDRVFAVIDFERPERVQAFLSSDDVRKAKFGSVVTPSAEQLPFRQIVQPDGFRITTLGKQIHVNYSIPNELREFDEDPFSHVIERMRRLVKSLSNLGDGRAKWVGVQCFLEEPYEGVTSMIDALKRWVDEIQSPVFAGSTPTTVSITIGVPFEGFYEGVTIQGYETREGQVGPMPSALVDPDTMPVVHAGMQYIVDFNTKPSGKADKVDRLMTAVLKRIEARYTQAIERGMRIAKGSKISDE